MSKEELNNMHYNYKDLQKKGIVNDDNGHITEVTLKTVDEFIASDKKHRADEVDFLVLMENMLALEKWCLAEPDAEHSIPLHKKTSFFSFYQDAIIGAYQRYRQSKKETWSLGKNWIWLVVTTILPILTAVILQALTEGEGVLIGVSNIIACAIAVFWICAKIYDEWVKNKNDKETWARHSVCFCRLNLLLSRFLLSDRSDKDFLEFSSNTFTILEQNLDQFTLNLSIRGIAPRAKKVSGQ